VSGIEERYEIHNDDSPREDEGAIDSEQIASSSYEAFEKSGANNTSNRVHGLLLRHLH
jgi:hypothetical protein